jgi:hypothetical protein
MTTMRMVANRVLDLRVRMHESGTSAEVRFRDEHGQEHRVALVARSGGGALFGCVAKRYEAPLLALGQELWPSGAPERDAV